MVQEQAMLQAQRLYARLAQVLWRQCFLPEQALP
jgi:hypothetical protein